MPWHHKLLGGKRNPRCIVRSELAKMETHEAGYPLSGLSLIIIIIFLTCYLMSNSNFVLVLFNYPKCRSTIELKSQRNVLLCYYCNHCYFFIYAYAGSTSNCVIDG